MYTSQALVSERSSATAMKDLASSYNEGAVLARCLSKSLDHVGRGMLLVQAGGRVLHANRIALQALDDAHPLRIEAGTLRAHHSADAAKLTSALEAATRRGLRHMLHLEGGDQRLTVAVLPIDDEGGGAALVSFEQVRGMQNLSVQCYARQHRFTSAETGVLQALVAGESVVDIARTKGVALSTVRTQIGQLRQKAGAHSIRQLLDRVAALPPMMAVVQ
jgi:DNA-binding CsgD family transcriptional regulator